MSKLLQITAVFALALILTSDVDARGSRGGSSRGSSKGASARKSGGTKSAAKSGGRTASKSGKSASKNGTSGKSGSKNGTAGKSGNGANHGGNAGHGGYRGAGYRGWSSWNWNPGFGCYFYLSDGAYYYWYAPDMIYRPVTDIQMYPPSPVQYSTAAPGNPPMPMPIAR